MAAVADYIQYLRCPETGPFLRETTLTEFELQRGAAVIPLRTNDLEKGDTRFGLSKTVLV